MRAPHMFATWFMARELSPDIIVESGIWKGQSTWLFEVACPGARLISLDLDLRPREYISSKAAYSDRDFSEQDWSAITERSLVFFDDHQNAYRRLQQCKWFGFKHVIFEDNYPVSQGDCYSLKKAFAHAGFEPANSGKSDAGGKSAASRLLRKAAGTLGVNPITLTPQYQSVKVAPNRFDADVLRKHIDIYYEFPPVIKAAETRWGDEWSEDSYPTPEPLVKTPEAVPEFFTADAKSYTWICYVRLK